jgi:hypothetical protein
VAMVSEAGAEHVAHNQWHPSAGSDVPLSLRDGGGAVQQGTHVAIWRSGRFGVMG